MIPRRASIRRTAPLRRAKIDCRSGVAPSPNKNGNRADSANESGRTKAKRKTFKLPQDQTHRQRVVIANKIWRGLIRLKEPSGICPRCFTRPWHDAAHCFAKGPYPGMRFDLDNGAPVCRPCHRRIDSDHQAKLLFFQHYLGPARYARLELMSQARGKTDVALAILHLRAMADSAEGRS